MNWAGSLISLQWAVFYLSMGSNITSHYKSKKEGLKFQQKNRLVGF